MPSSGRDRSRVRRSILEKIAIVRESLKPGITAAHVAKRHGIALNVLYYWRKVYREIATMDLTAAVGVASEEHSEVADLRLQVRNLERLLGQRTLEIALLKEKLGMAQDGEESHE